MSNETNNIHSIIGALPRPEDDAAVKACATKRTAILAHVEDLVEQAGVAAAGQHAAEQALAEAATNGDKRKLADAESQLDAALLQRQRLTARARALDLAVGRLDAEEAAAWPAAVARARVAWNDAAAPLTEAHAAALGALKTAENDIAVYGNALAAITGHSTGRAIVQFDEGTQVDGASYSCNDTAAFPVGVATDVVRRGLATFVGADSWRQHLVLLLDPDLAGRRAAARAARSRPTTPPAHLSGRGATPSALPGTGALDPTGMMGQ